MLVNLSWVAHTWVLHERCLVMVGHQGAIVDTLVDRSEILGHLNVFKRVITRAHHLLCILTVGKREEIGLRVETAVWHRLVAFLAR